MMSAIEWLLAPISGADTHGLAPWAYWHARLMVLGWNVLLPLGMLIARFSKVTPGQDWPHVVDNITWWRLHLGLQISGVAVVSLGLCLALGQGGRVGRAAELHHLAGWTLLTIGWLQMLGGTLRGTKGGPTSATMRGDHYDMTGRRLVFEVVHKHLGWAAVPLVLLATGIGLSIADAPRWMPLVLGCWWLLLIMAFIKLQRAGRCIDTYQAIWGPDPAHPGNQRRPLGWGIVRPPQQRRARRGHPSAP